MKCIENTPKGSLIELSHTFTLGIKHKELQCKGGQRLVRVLYILRLAKRCLNSEKNPDPSSSYALLNESVS